MRIGKLPPELLARLLGSIAIPDRRVRIGPRQGEDAGVIELGDQNLIITTDPITFVTEHAAWYAVQVNANDLAAMGADPAWLAATILLPPDVTEASVSALFSQLTAACDSLGATLVTGHTEVTSAVTRPIISGTMFGVAAHADLITSAGARPGDAIILAGPIAGEGTAILAVEAATMLLARGLTSKVIDRAAAFLQEPGISVVRAARVVRGVVLPHALHDATEGGIATALREMATCSGVGLTLNASALQVLPETALICEALGIDPLGLISSGCLIAVVPEERATAVVTALSAADILCAHAGTIVAGDTVLLQGNGATTPLPVFDRDEIARYFDSL